MEKSVNGTYPARCLERKKQDALKGNKIVSAVSEVKM